MVRTRHGKCDLSPPKIKSRNTAKKQKENISGRTNIHWFYGKFLHFEFSKTVLPTKRDVIKRYRNLYNWMCTGDRLTQNQKDGIYHIIAKGTQFLYPRNKLYLIFL